jgi:hypothetical protein
MVTVTVDAADHFDVTLKIYITLTKSLPNKFNLAGRIKIIFPHKIIIDFKVSKIDFKTQNQIHFLKVF